jgi:hypothetical protein
MQPLGGLRDTCLSAHDYIMSWFFLDVHFEIVFFVMRGSCAMLYKE